MDEAVAYRAKEAGLNIIHLRGVPDSHTGAYAKKQPAAEADRTYFGGSRHERDGAADLKENREGSVSVIQKFARLNDTQLAERSYQDSQRGCCHRPADTPEVIQQSLRLAGRSDARVRNVDQQGG